jgi:hypothetical protein
MWLVIINTLISIVGVMGGIMLASGSIMSIANMSTISWAGTLLLMAFGVPVMFGISGIGAWIAYAFAWNQAIPWLIALPWVFLAVFIAAMLLTFQYLK